MDQIVPIDVTRFVLDLHRDFSVTPRATKSGPPQRVDGMTIGFVSVTTDAPHKGEVHPDGDEILYVISGLDLTVRRGRSRHRPSRRHNCSTDRVSARDHRPISAGRG